jgi:hypothetical protein
MSDGQDGRYRKPPEAHQFKPGKSGNPRGRPKGTRNLKTDLTRLLKRRISVREDGETRHISRQEAILLSLYSKAISGDVRATMSILTMLMKLEPTMTSEPAQDEVSPRDEEIIEDYLRREAAIRDQNNRPSAGSEQNDGSQTHDKTAEDCRNGETARSRRTFGGIDDEG